MEESQRNSRTEEPPLETTETPFVKFCDTHKDSKGNPLAYSVLGYRTAHKKVNGIWTDYEEPIYECMKCVFPDE